MMKYLITWEDESMLKLVFEYFARPHEAVQRRRELLASGFEVSRIEKERVDVRTQ